MPTPRPVEFRSLKHLLRRMHSDRDAHPREVISVDDPDLPHWQRQLVWTADEMGLLCYSILHGYPIGQIVLWRLKDGIRVPIDGRQRLTAIKRFFEGHVALPDLPHITPEFRGKKYRLREGDTPDVLLATRLRDDFDDYEPAILEYDEIDEDIAKDIFVKLQGGKSLNKTEIRAALPGLVTDFVSDLTSPPTPVSSDIDEDEADTPLSKHEFFAEIAVKNRRKAHRNVCDILLHEFLSPGRDKHWASLESMYLDKAKTLSERERAGFRTSLSRFHRAVRVQVKDEWCVHPYLRSAYLILTYYRVWRALQSLSLPATFRFVDMLREFEEARQENKDEPPFVNFNAALSNAGYAMNRCDQRHRILMGFVLGRVPDAEPRDSKRGFTVDQKVAIWDRADGQCEWEDDGERCTQVFPDFREADADHVVRWSNAGPTSLSNGRLLCPKHNRSPR